MTRPTITKKRKFNRLLRHWWNLQLLTKENFDGLYKQWWNPQLPKKEKLMVTITVPKTILK